MRLVVALWLAVLVSVTTAQAANDLSNEPWVLDTASGSLVVTGDVRVSCIKWVGGGSAGQQAVLQDAANKTIWEEIAPGANFSSHECGMYFFKGGLKIPTLGAGKVYIYVR